MRSRKLTIPMTLAALSGALSGGCLMDGPAHASIEQPRSDDRVTGEPYRPIIDAVAGRLSGDIGPMSGLDHQATQLSAYDDGYYISIETVVEMQDRAVMTLLSVSQGAELFKPGLKATFLLDDDSQTRVTVLGCVGQDVDVYDEWDKPADEVDIEVNAPEENPDELEVDLMARWFDRDEYGERLSTFRSGATTLTLTR